MRYLSLFSGIGAFEKALTRLGIDYELVGFSEIDKYAIKSYCAVHNVDESLNLGDISKIDLEKLPDDIDLITHGSPCQDFSVAGLQAGGDKGTGTRSSLMWCTVDIVEKVKPKYVIWENVKNLLSKSHRHNFDSYIEVMDKLGYNSYYQVLNAKDFGIPQNRERVYTVSIRKDIDKNDFKFPEKEELKLRLKDMLEKEVDEKYYLSNKMKEYIFDINDKQENTKWANRADNGKLNPNIAYTLSVRSAGGSQRAGVSNFIINEISEEISVIDVKRIFGLFDTEKSKHQAGSVYDKYGLAPTLDTMQGGWRQPCIIQDLKIRRLTPKECFRLMGFDDTDFDKAKAVPTSDTQLYKQARKLDLCTSTRKDFYTTILILLTYIVQ